MSLCLERNYNYCIVNNFQQKTDLSADVLCLLFPLSQQIKLNDEIYNYQIQTRTVNHLFPSHNYPIRSNLLMSADVKYLMHKSENPNNEKSCSNWRECPMHQIYLCLWCVRMSLLIFCLTSQSRHPMKAERWLHQCMELSDLNLWYMSIQSHIIFISVDLCDKICLPE